MLLPTFRLSALLFASACFATQARADFLYTTSGLPAPMVNGQSFVAFIPTASPNHALPTNTNTDLVLANVVGFSTNTGAGDAFNTPITLNVDFADPAHPGGDAAVSFTGTLAGNLGSGQSSLRLDFAAQSAVIDLAGNSYAVTVPLTSILVSGNGSQTAFGIHIQPAGSPVSQVPEPSTVLLAAFGVPLVGLKRLRKCLRRLCAA